MERVRPDGTWDTAWDIGSGYWYNSSSWDNGVPNANAFTYLPQGNSATITTSAQVRMLNNQGTVHVQNNLTAGDIRNSGGHIYMEGGTLTATRSIINDGNPIAKQLRLLQIMRSIYDCHVLLFYSSTEIVIGNTFI